MVSRETRRPARPGAWRRRGAEPPPRERAGVVGCGGQGAAAAKGEDRGGVGWGLSEGGRSGGVGDTTGEKGAADGAQDGRRCEKSWRRMANIPDQVDAALMAKLRLQSQSPGEEERGWGLVGRGCEVLWRTVDGGRHDGGRRRGVAKERTPLCPLSNPPMDGHWLALVQGFRTDGRLDAMLAKRAFSRTADGRVGKGRRRQGMRWRGRSAQRPRLEAESNNSVGERTAACGVSGCACGWAEAHGAIEALDAHATDEGGTCSRATGTRARSLVVVGRSVEGADGVVGGRRLDTRQRQWR